MFLVRFFFNCIFSAFFLLSFSMKTPPQISEYFNGKKLYLTQGIVYSPFEFLAQNNQSKSRRALNLLKGFEVSIPVRGVSQSVPRYRFTDLQSLKRLGNNIYIVNADNIEQCIQSKFNSINVLFSSKIEIGNSVLKADRYKVSSSSVESIVIPKGYIFVKSNGQFYLAGYSKSMELRGRNSTFLAGFLVKEHNNFMDSYIAHSLLGLESIEQN